MTKKEKVLNFVKKHKKEILIGAGIGACGGLLGGVIIRNRTLAKHPYKVIVRTNNKEYRDALNDMFNWRTGEVFDGAYIGTDLTDAEIRDRISGLLGEDSDKYQYSMLLERIKQS